MKRTPLKRGLPLKARTPLTRTAALTPSARAATRTTPTVPAPVRQALVARSGGVCEMALPGCTRSATDVAHRVKRGMGGRKGAAKVRHDSLSNTLHACRACHSWTHARPAEAYEVGLMLREGQDPAREPVVYRGALVFLDDDGVVRDFHGHPYAAAPRVA